MRRFVVTLVDNDSRRGVLDKREYELVENNNDSHIIRICIYAVSLSMTSLRSNSVNLEFPRFSLGREHVRHCLAYRWTVIYKLHIRTLHCSVALLSVGIHYFVRATQNKATFLF